MKMQIILVTLLIGISSFTLNTGSVGITWVENLQGNFSFAKKQSIICEAWCYEWAGTNKITAVQVSKDTVHCFTAMNTATHCSLDLTITDSSCIPTIELKSIAPNGDKTYPYEKGYIKIDRTLWKKKILKAEFDFVFKNDENNKIVFWKGKIYTKIK